MIKLELTREQSQIMICGLSKIIDEINLIDSDDATTIQKVFYREVVFLYNIIEKSIDASYTSYTSYKNQRLYF